MGSNIESLKADNISPIRKDPSTKTKNLKQRIIRIVPSKSGQTKVTQPQLKEVKSRSRLDIMRSKMAEKIKSGKKLVEKNFTAPARGKWEHAIHDAVKSFDQKT